MANFVRVDRVMSNQGFVSRKETRGFLREHVVTVNGVRVTDPGMRIDQENDEVLVEGERVKMSGHVYYVLHKPTGVISSTSDHEGKKTVVDFIETKAQIFPVGRLDKETTGLILLTDDGELAHRLIHPKFHVPRVYELTVQGIISDVQLEALRKGVMLVDGMTLPAKVERLRNIQYSISNIQYPMGNNGVGEDGGSVLEVTLVEGRNRQIRRMCIALGIGLTALKREKFGNIELGNLAEGEYRELSEEEIKILVVSRKS